jgi:glycosyltransferase involved in cell wall biosynthesis
MIFQTGTFLQIHYHNRPGGVSTVMRQYAGAFSHLCSGLRPPVNLIVCRASAGPEALTGVDRVVDVKDCGYRFFRRRAAFVAAKKRIMRALTLIIDDRALPRPIIVVGHNMNLGKNCALSCAFAEAARRYSATREDVLFFSIVHDFAEEGRVDLLRQIQAVRRLGIDLWNDLYPSLKNLRFVTPNARNRALLSNAGYPVTLLPNPVTKPGTGVPRGKAMRARLRASLREIGKKENAKVMTSMPVLLYPSRMISRKNPVEAVLVAHVLFKSCLLFGACGTSAKDRSLAAALKALCWKYGVPVIVDAGRIARRVVLQGDSFPLLYSIADECLTTSIAEGFGYAIHEPAFYGKKIIGRFPDGFPVSEKRKYPYLYKRLLIPCTWVDMGVLKRRYYDRLKTISGGDIVLPAFGPFSGMFDRAFTRGDGIDFGCLDVNAQLDILRRCLQSPRAVQEWKQAFPSQTKRMAASFHAGSRGAIASHVDSFEKSFARCYCRKHTAVRPRPDADPKFMLRHFCRCGHFRLLMTPQRVSGSAA